MENWHGKKIAVIGLGVSNIPVIRFLLKHQALVIGKDKKSEEQLGATYRELMDLGVTLELGTNYLANLQSFDGIFLTPGMPKDLPELKAISGRVPFYSEISLVLSYAKAPVFGITGSSGKTTTTTLVGEMLKASGIRTFVGGNIGTPLIEQIETIPANSRIVLELSSFQLEMLTDSPQGALVTNISENHLDIHGTMENYINAKKQIYLHQTAHDVALFNFDDPITYQMSKETPGKAYYFSLKEPVDPGAYLAGDDLIYQENGKQERFMQKSELRLVGEHNVANVLAAAVFAHLAGADWTTIRQVCQEFAGVSHRLEKVLDYQGVHYYNDSIATSPQRAIAGLKAFSEPVILIAGGYDKKLSFTPLAPVIIERVKELILVGATADQIEQAVRSRQSTGNTPAIHRVRDMEEAVRLAFSRSQPGDVVLLSPGCASFDMYSNYQARGEHFARLVRSLATEEAGL